MQTAVEKLHGQNDYINSIFQATVEATEESIVNALIAGEDMVGHLTED